MESFGSRIRDELLAVELFSCLAEAKVLIEDWRVDYNEHRPHSALGMMAPSVFARGYREADLAAAPPTSSHSRWTDERGPVTYPSAVSAAKCTRLCVRGQRASRQLTTLLKSALPDARSRKTWSG